jgi:Flp pilus assembly protein TadG
MSSHRLKGERGQTLREASRALRTLLFAIALPTVLLVSVCTFEFGRAYRTYQVLNNAVREGARVAVLPDSAPAAVRSRVIASLQAGQLPKSGSATVSVDQKASMSNGAATASAAMVTVNYPFSFMLLNPVANLVANGSAVDTPLTFIVSAAIRNEAGISSQATPRAGD